jgi:hypothetical protein
MKLVIFRVADDGVSIAALLSPIPRQIDQRVGLMLPMSRPSLDGNAKRIREGAWIGFAWIGGAPDRIGLRRMEA